MRSICCVIVGTLILTESASAETFNVNPGDSIQAVLNATSHGDIVELAAGSWQENLTMPGHALVLRGAIDELGQPASSIDGDDGRAIVIENSLHNVTFEHLVVSGQHANNGGGYDLAYLFDSTGDDAFYGRPNNSWLTGNGFLNFAQAFDRVNAYSTAGGNDAAYLFDSAGDDTFYDHSNSSWLLGDEFFNYGQGFSRVEAHLSDSGSDMAVFYDLADDDELSADGRWLAVRHGSRVVEGHDLDHVLAYARTGEHLTTDVSNVDFVFERIGDWSS